jgi:hypothetical protein
MKELQRHIDAFEIYFKKNKKAMTLQRLLVYQVLSVALVKLHFTHGRKNLIGMAGKP